MDRALKLDHLLLAQSHVALGEQSIARQQALIDRLRSDGHDTAEAEKLLAEFEAVQAMHVEGAERLRRELAEELALPDAKNAASPAMRPVAGSERARR